jgi:hypothetical protein
VNVDVVTVAAFIGSLKVTVTAVLIATFADAFGGLTAETVGGVTSAAPTVVKLLANGDASPLPAMSFASVATFTVYELPPARGETGSHETLFRVWNVSIPGIGEPPPAGVTKKVELLIVL